jgi:hypothetical protein
MARRKFEQNHALPAVIGNKKFRMSTGPRQAICYLNHLGAVVGKPAPRRTLESFCNRPLNRNFPGPCSRETKAAIYGATRRHIPRKPTTGPEARRYVSSTSRSIWNPAFPYLLVLIKELQPIDIYGFSTPPQCYGRLEGVSDCVQVILQRKRKFNVILYKHELPTLCP